MDNQERQRLCLKCMLCCKEIAIATAYDLSPDSEDGRQAREFWMARGFNILFEEGVWWLEHLNWPCPELTEHGCRIYDKRPLICAEYDGLADSMMAARCRWGGVSES